METSTTVTAVSSRLRALATGLFLLLGIPPVSACVEDEEDLLDDYGYEEDEEFRSGTYIDASGDAMFKENYPTTNFGNTTDLRIRKNTNNDKKSVLQFNLSSFSGTITSAHLRLCGIGTNYAGRGFEVTYVGELLAGSNTKWSESNVNWANQPDPVPGEIREPAVMPSPGQCTLVPLTTSRVQAEIDGDDKILSLKLTRGLSTDDKSLSLASREYADPNMRPRLELTY